LGSGKDLFEVLENGGLDNGNEVLVGLILIFHITFEFAHDDPFRDGEIQPFLFGGREFNVLVGNGFLEFGECASHGFILTPTLKNWESFIPHKEGIKIE
jgi:hypothetical protein